MYVKLRAVLSMEELQQKRAIKVEELQTDHRSVLEYQARKELVRKQHHVTNGLEPGSYLKTCDRKADWYSLCQLK